jgi:hypothetical protein
MKSLLSFLLCAVFVSVFSSNIFAVDQPSCDLEKYFANENKANADQDRGPAETKKAAAEAKLNELENAYCDLEANLQALNEEQLFEDIYTQEEIDQMVETIGDALHGHGLFVITRDMNYGDSAFNTAISRYNAGVEAMASGDIAYGYPEWEVALNDYAHANGEFQAAHAAFNVARGNYDTVISSCNYRLNQINEWLNP